MDIRNDVRNVAIIAHVDHGKTTLVDLILRTYNVPDGTLFIDGYDVNKIPIKTVRANAAYVPQDNFLFSDTIENNIAFATDNADLDGVIEAGRAEARKRNIPICDCTKKWKNFERAGVDTTLFLSGGINHPYPDMHWLFATTLIETLFDLNAD